MVERMLAKREERKRGGGTHRAPRSPDDEEPPAWPEDCFYRLRAVEKTVAFLRRFLLRLGKNVCWPGSRTKRARYSKGKNAAFLAAGKALDSLSRPIHWERASMWAACCNARGPPAARACAKRRPATESDKQGESRAYKCRAVFAVRRTKGRCLCGRGGENEKGRVWTMAICATGFCANKKTGMTPVLTGRIAPFPERGAIRFCSQ